MNQPKLAPTSTPIPLWLNAFLPPILWAGFIFIISAQQVIPGPDVFLYDFLLKKTAHMLVYAVFYLLVWRGVKLTINPEASKLHWLLPLIICLLYAVSDEIHQSFVPGRYATLRDVGYDMIGAGLVFFRKYRYI